MMIDRYNPKNKRKNDKETLDKLWFFSIFLFSINFLDFNLYLMYFSFSTGLIVIYYKKSTFKITSNFILLLIFTVSYFFTLNYFESLGIYSLLLFFLGPILCFIIGFFIVNNDKIVIKTIIIIVVGNFLHGFFNMINYFSINGINSNERDVIDIWSGIARNATLQGTHFTLVVSLLGIVIIMISSKNKVWLSLILFSFILFSLFSSFILGNRTLLLLTIIILTFNVIFYAFFNRRSFKKNFSFLSIWIFIIFSSYFIYSKNFFEIKNTILNSNLINRLDDTEIKNDPRNLVYEKALNQFLDFPFGGYRMDLGLEYAHNLWIDVLYAAGLIPFFSLLFFTLFTIYHVSVILRKNNVSQILKLFILSIFSAYLLNFMVEPILEGVPYMFMSFCILSGMLNKLVLISKTNKVPV